uniref:Bm10592 n=1 Tax=Brugia malayi TaxID=6279 RepID=A0A1I9G3T6_BRUMA|nr:Bm10592 [Brugia malayi]
MCVCICDADAQTQEKTYITGAARTCIRPRRMRKRGRTVNAKTYTQTLKTQKYTEAKRTHLDSCRQIH